MLANENGHPLGWGGRLCRGWERVTRSALGTCSTCSAPYASWSDEDECAHADELSAAGDDLERWRAEHR